MSKTILITGATDGIGLETAKILAAQGHTLLLHGRNSDKLEKVIAALNMAQDIVHGYVADLSDLNSVSQFANQVLAQHKHLDALINNAGVFKTPAPLTPQGQDVRFVVNTLAPYILTKKLGVILTPFDGRKARVVNLSSAAQAPVNNQAITATELSQPMLSDMEAYAQSKLAITMWTKALAQQSAQQENAPIYMAVNPGSLLASKMVKEGFGVPGSDLSIGANILCEMALNKAHENRNGQYFDNDAKQFSVAHSFGENNENVSRMMVVIEDFAAPYLS